MRWAKSGSGLSPFLIRVCVSFDKKLSLKMKKKRGKKKKKRNVHLVKKLPLIQFEKISRKTRQFINFNACLHHILKDIITTPVKLPLPR